MAAFRCNATVLAFASSLLCSMPLQVQAAPELVATTSDTPRTQRSAFAQGKDAALRDDAEGAVEAWAGVLNATPESVKTRRFRMNLIVDTIHVALDAHARKPDRELLERTLDVYYAYFSAHEAQYGNPNIPGPVVQARFELKAALEAAAPPEEPVPPPEPSPPPEAPPTRVSLSTADPHPDGTGLLIAGGVTMGLGAGLTSLIAVGAINGKRTREDQSNPAYSPEQRSRIDAEGKKANTLFIAGLVSAPLALVTGAVLVGVGAKRRVDTRRYAHVAPTLSPSFAGVQVQGRF